MAIKEFLKKLGTLHKDRLRVKIETQKGKVKSFVIQYEAKIDEHWYQIVRYDCAHNYVHRDLIVPDGSKEKKPIFLSTLEQALLYAEQDLEDRWEWYREHFERRKKK